MLLAASALAHFDRSLLDSQWNQWKLTHRREYGSQVSRNTKLITSFTADEPSCLDSHNEVELVLPGCIHWFFLMVLLLLLLKTLALKRLKIHLSPSCYISFCSAALFITTNGKVRLGTMEFP